MELPCLPPRCPGTCRCAKLFGPVPLPFAVATYSLPPVKLIDIGIHSVGKNPIGSTMPSFAAFAVSFVVSITATASEIAFATYNRDPSGDSASASGSAPK